MDINYIVIDYFKDHNQFEISTIYLEEIAQIETLRNPKGKERLKLNEKKQRNQRVLNEILKIPQLKLIKNHFLGRKKYDFSNDSEHNRALKSHSNKAQVLKKRD